MQRLEVSGAVRPIYGSLGVKRLISFSKIFEKVIYTRIYIHVVLHKILANEQYGFRNGLSTDNASYTLIWEVLSAMNNKYMVGEFFVI